MGRLTICPQFKKTMNKVNGNQTIQSMMLGGDSIKYREVYVRDLASMVKVTTEEVQSTYIQEGDMYDDLFYCYVPEDEFTELNDRDFEDYINKNF